MAKGKLQLCYTDTGGTFTDTFIVRSDGEFILGKAPTTPQDVGIGYFDSIQSALNADDKGEDLKGLFSQLEVIGYGATTVINTLITRTGKKLGLLITKGFEDYLFMERGLQTFEGYTLPDRLHAVTHVHNKPLIPKKLIYGVTERIDVLGEVVIPLYEHEVVEAVEKLISDNIEGIAVCFLWSFRNASHEKLAATIANKVIRQKNLDIPVYLSSEINPVIREYSRLNSTLIEGYAGDPAREPLLRIDKRIKELGYEGDLQILLSYGGLTSVKNVRMVESVQSGPVGGIIGTKFIANLYGFENVVATDVGGTTFDVGIVTNGVVKINREPTCNRFRLGIPMIEVDSIGAGGGTIIKIDKFTGRVDVGPESAGAYPGPVAYDIGGTEPTVTDVDLILGYFDPYYFMGGSIKINKEKAVEVFREKIAEPLKLDVHKAAEGVKDIIDTRMRGMIRGMIMGKGFAVEDYYLLAYGGGGPSHVAGYTKGMNLKGVLIFPYSSVFSAFGASTSDYEHHYIKSTIIVAPPNANDEIKMALNGQLNALWEELEKKAIEEMKAEGYTENDVKFKRLAMIRYGGQLDDLIIESRKPRLKSPSDWDQLISDFEAQYEKVFASVGKYPQAGYQILEAGIISVVEKLKPVIKEYELEGETPSAKSIKSVRQAYFSGQFHDTTVYNMDLLRPGNIIPGPALIEMTTTTLVIPPEKSTHMDKYKTLWLKNK